MVQGTSSYTKQRAIGTSILLLTAALTHSPDVLPENNYQIRHESAKEYYLTSNLDYTDIRTYDVSNKVKIMESFITKLATQTVDLTPEIVDAVNDNFWKLF